MFKNELTTKIAAAIFTGVMMMVLHGCKKEEAQHYVRVKNEYGEALKELKLDEVNFGRIEKGVVTGYKYVFPGTFPITIITESGYRGKGSVTLSGNDEGRQEWTIVVDQKGNVYGFRYKK